MWQPFVEGLRAVGHQIDALSACPRQSLSQQGPSYTAATVLGATAMRERCAWISPGKDGQPSARHRAMIPAQWARSYAKTWTAMRHRALRAGPAGQLRACR